MSASDAFARLQEVLDEAAQSKQMSRTELSAWTHACIAHVRSAFAEVEQARVDPEVRLTSALWELLERFRMRLTGLPPAQMKMLYIGVYVLLRRTVETMRARQIAGEQAWPCDCATWRTVAKQGGGSLVERPSLREARMVEEVSDLYESYRVYECDVCGARWLQDFNIDSDPSVPRWWPK
jgi:hypothetical protein